MGWLGWVVLGKEMTQGQGDYALGSHHEVHRRNRDPAEPRAARLSTSEMKQPWERNRRG